MLPACCFFLAVARKANIAKPQAAFLQRSNFLAAVRHSGQENAPPGRCGAIFRRFGAIPERWS
jgi:hypothetical protein